MKRTKNLNIDKTGYKFKNVFYRKITIYKAEIKYKIQ